MNGMNNLALEVNLSESEEKGNVVFSKNEISDEILKRYLGGRALGVKLFTERVDPKIDPYDENNLLIFAVGPFSTTMVPTNGRFSLVTKSPLTNGIFYSNSGGFFGPNLKKCGYDALIINGKLKTPKYLVLDGDNVYLKDATSLWGMDTESCLDKLKEFEGKNIYTLIIGPAGENLVRYAAIMTDAERAFGRGGVGAVMGSKKLKAIVVKNGRKKIEINDREWLKKLVHSALDEIRVVPITRSALPRFGTSGLINIINKLGMLPIKNFQKGYDPAAENISGESIRKHIFVKQEGCFGCPIQCGRKTKVGDISGKGPEYETDWALGANLGIFNLEVVAKGGYLCNRLGLDTISCGGTIACAMELNQRGIFNETDKQDQWKDVKFGNERILLDLIKKIAYREGIGNELAEGSKRFAEKYNSLEFAMQVKGLELPAYDPRGAFGHALGYATSNRGGCHLTGYMASMEIFAVPKKIDRFSTAAKADLLILKQNGKVIEDSVSVCAFAGFALGLDFYARFLTAITGEEYTVVKLLEIGNEIYNLEHEFNLQAGLNKSEDKLPPRFITQPLKEGFSKDKVVPLEQMLKDYYFIRKW
ncbi:MAG: aldehyde ferredoxin oxidoreductase family protein [Promethearchaeota archaeon]